MNALSQTSLLAALLVAQSAATQPINDASVAEAIPPIVLQRDALCRALEEAAVGMDLSRDTTMAAVRDDLRIASVAASMASTTGISPDAKEILNELASSRKQSAELGQSIAERQRNFADRMHVTLAKECR